MNFRNLLKPAFIAGIFCCASVSVFAQGAYMKLGSGYNLGGNGDLKYNITATATYGPDPNSNATSYNVKYERVNISLGNGLLYGGAVGYMFNKYIGLEMGINKLSGEENELINSTTETPSRGYNSVNNRKLFSKMLYLQPSLVLGTEIGITKPYSRFGLVAAKGTIYEIITDNSERGEYIWEGTYYDGWAIGLHGALGVELKIYNHFSIFGEATITELEYSPERAKLSKATANGTDFLSSLTIREKEAEYTYDYEVNHTDKPIDTSPLKQPKFSMPFGSIGFGVGLKYNF